MPESVWRKAFGPKDDVHREATATLDDLYGKRARLVEVRPATEDEESQYLRGEQPKNVYCPSGTSATLPFA